MKTISKNISLTTDLAEFAQKEIQEGGYGNDSAYFADLIRQRRQAQIDADLALLKDAMRDAPGDQPPIDDIVAACKETRTQMRKEKWKP